MSYVISTIAKKGKQWRGFLIFVSDWHHIFNQLDGVRKGILTVGLAGLSYMMTHLFDDNENQLLIAAGISKSVMQLIIGLVCAAVLIVLFMLERRKIPAAYLSINLPPPAGGIHLTSVDYRSSSLAEAMTKELIPRLFPSHLNPLGVETMPYEVMDEVGKKNQYTAVGVYDAHKKRYVAYASFWPVHAEIGRKLMNGEMTDSELKTEDVLAEGELSNCKYAIICGFGATVYDAKTGASLTLRLKSSLKRLIAERYLTTTEKSMTVIALAFSNPGQKLCEDFGMIPTKSFANYGDGRPVPIYSRTITLRDLVFS